MSKKKSTVKKIFDVITTILVFAYVIVALAISLAVFTSMKTGHPSLFGYSFMFVKTDSMEGDAEDAIFKGDMVLCKQQDNYESLEVGQIIAYEVTVTDDNDVPVEIVKIHRIVEIEGNNYITKGDNTPAIDEYRVAPHWILGVYEGTRIPVLGSVFEFLQSQNGILFCLVIPMAAFFIYALYKFVKAMIEYKMTKAASADGELTEEQKQAAIAEYLAKQAAEANKDENNTDNTSEE